MDSAELAFFDGASWSLSSICNYLAYIDYILKYQFSPQYTEKFSPLLNLVEIFIFSK